MKSGKRGLYYDDIFFFVLERRSFSAEQHSLSSIHCCNQLYRVNGRWQNLYPNSYSERNILHGNKDLYRHLGFYLIKSATESVTYFNTQQKSACRQTFCATG